jgi:hypothetical protein
MNEISECRASIGESATLADIPDEGLREQVRAKIIEIILKYYDSDVDNAETITSRFDALPFRSIQQFIVSANTPEYMDKYADDLFYGVESKFLDLDILALGRPAASLEYVPLCSLSTDNFCSNHSTPITYIHQIPREVSTQCNILQALNPSAEELNQEFALDPDAFASNVTKSLNESYSPLLQLYKCGDIDTVVGSSIVNSDPELDLLLLDERNEQMAAKIDEVLRVSDPNKKTLFAVGLAHWLTGNNNMITLLEDYGYSMEHIPYWNSTQLENPSNEYCNVLYNPEAGIFVEDSSISTVTSDVVPSPYGEGGSSNTTPTKMPSHVSENEVAPEPATTSASCTMSGIETMMIGWSAYMFQVFVDMML